MQPVSFMLNCYEHLGEDQINSDRIQSPRGSIDIIAHYNFEAQNPDFKINTDRSGPTHTNPQLDIADSDNQLVWSNPIRQILHPQILRQLAYSNTLLHMAKTPLGVNLFWKGGRNLTPIEWKQLFSTLKMAIKARDSIEVDKLLKLKPQPTDLFYPTLPKYEEEFEGETEHEARNNEQRNERRRLDFETKCKVIER